MRYMILLKGNQPPTPPPAELMDAIMKLGEEATAAGALLDTAGLAPSAAGARVSLYGGTLSVTDGRSPRRRRPSATRCTRSGPRKKRWSGPPGSSSCTATCGRAGKAKRTY